MSVPRVPFEKYHGTGNDFLVVRADADVPDRAAFAAAHCDRETGVRAGERSEGRRGADGVLFLSLDAEATPPRVPMTLVQPDGSIAEMCGNGARCAALWATRDCGARRVVLDTPAGDRRATVTDPGAGAADPATVEVEMGRPSFDPERVPLSEAVGEPLVEENVEGLTVTAVNTGVPHAVAFVDDVNAVDLDAVAPPVRHADVFPEGANVTLASVADDGDDGDDERTDAAGASGADAADADAADGADDAPVAFRQRTYERGVEGETRACGTGAVAVVAVARRLGLTDGASLRVSPPGGDLRVTVPAGGPATLTGPATREFAGELEADPR
ncbi:diaminopimelate epimerase [Candidatus Halobonum tyrrellensis]|uniref:Diaminopimelate epimerase n=1 Tax=Candidatus Halobonum tyrrellensis G22 TaxID=1324957 RepID=V4GW51_9EURY|nr:diaminopimelate epimerase [Candidatus Halobonum tyrrellensis]ESP89371.1 diaminopimelate epimerase [Candidatus Halobonum tyrrellensis G22]